MKKKVLSSVWWELISVLLLYCVFVTEPQFKMVTSKLNKAGDELIFFEGAKCDVTLKALKFSNRGSWTNFADCWKKYGNCKLWGNVPFNVTHHLRSGETILLSQSNTVMRVRVRNSALTDGKTVPVKSSPLFCVMTLHTSVSVSLSVPSGLLSGKGLQCERVLCWNHQWWNRLLLSGHLCLLIQIKRHLGYEQTHD